MPEFATAYFPDYSVEFGFTFGLNFNTTEVRFSNRRRQARLHDSRPQRTLEGRVPATTWDSSEAIRSFITARGGNFEAFFVFAWMRQKFFDLEVGVGTGVVADFTVNLYYSGSGLIDGTVAANLHLIDVEVAGSLQVEGVDYSWTGSPISHDITLNFLPGHLPADGAAVTVIAIGRERIPVVLNGNVLRVDHPLRRPQDAAGPADFYSIPVIEVF